MLAHRFWPRWSRVTDRWWFECKYERWCECPPTLEPGCAPCGNHITSIRLSSPMQVTPSLVSPTTDRSSCDTTNTRSSLQLSRGVPGGLALPGDCLVTGHIPIRTVCELGLVLGLGVCKLKLKPQPKHDTPTPNQAKRGGAVPWDSFRLEAEEDVNTRSFISFCMCYLS